MSDLMLSAFLGFALGLIWQEIHFSKLRAELDDLVDLVRRMEGME